MKSRSRRKRVQIGRMAMWTIDPKPSDLPMSRIEGTVKRTGGPGQGTLKSAQMSVGSGEAPIEQGAGSLEIALGRLASESKIVEVEHCLD